MTPSPLHNSLRIKSFFLATLLAAALLGGCGDDQVLQPSGSGSQDVGADQTGLDGLPGEDALTGDATPTADAGEDAAQPDVAPDTTADTGVDGDPGDSAGTDAEGADVPDTQPGDTSQTDAEPTDANPGDADPSDSAPSDTAPSDTASNDTANNDIAQLDSQVDTGPADAGCQGPQDCPAATEPCKVAVCQAGACSIGPAADATPCSDGDACTTGDKCQAGACTAGAPVVCAGDGNPCLAWACDKTSGQCSSAPTTATCSDGNACTTADACKDGKCAGNALTCDDNNPCTTDSCDPAKGCTTANNTLPCATGNLCIKPGVCKDGACTGSVPTDCDDGNPCTVDSCDPQSGVCQFAGSVTGACEDGNPCTANDTCQKGLCKAGPAKVCDDENPCTVDTCVAPTGCIYTPTSGPCSDGDTCTEGDACAAGTCKGAAVVCDDGNPCTADTCDKAKGCLFTPNNLPCSVDACHTGTCVQGKCANVIVKLCNDNNVCTADTCDNVNGCANAPVLDGTLCGVGSKCVEAPVCKTGACQPAIPVNCGDGNACTKDTCDPQTGCTWTAITGGCDDGNACTVGEACGPVPGKGIQCTGGTPIDAAKVCDDKNACTNDSCDPVKGCIHINNVQACDDANVCTTNDACFAGNCVGTPSTKCDDGNGCTTDKCDPLTGNCSWSQAPGGTCNDNNPCTPTDTCVGAACVGSGSLCDDGSGCTTDSCDKASGKCSYTLVVCSDGNSCTSDSCDPVTGKCAFVANTLPCVAPDKCAAAGLCDGKGTCKATGGSKCDDGNPCTADSCDSNTGACKNAPAGDGTTCDDGVGCTADSVCTGGKCQSPTGCVVYSEPFVCPAKTNWIYDVPAPTPPGVLRTVVWNIDGVPLTPAGTVEHQCTLNFNNGVNYCDALLGQPGMCQVPLGSATQPVVSNFTKAGGLIPVLIFDTYYDVDTFVPGGDQPLVEILDATTKAVLASQLLPVGAGDLKKWKEGYKLAFPAAMGKQVLVRFSLGQPQGTTGSQGNTGAGFFVDNLKFTALAGAEVCDDGLDNDGNYKVDCADPACAAVPACYEADCSDGQDGDKDGATDCSDSNCLADPACSGVTLFTDNFDCGDKVFTFQASAPPISWAVDAPPAGIKLPSGVCCLNYNNGVNFDSGNNTANAGSAIGNFEVDATGKTTVRADFWAYFDTELGTGTSNFDRLYLSVTTDDFAGCATSTATGNYSSQLCNTTGTYTAAVDAAVAKTWQHVQIPLTGFGGKKFKLRIKFDTADSISNTGAGPFIDDMRIFAK